MPTEIIILKGRCGKEIKGKLWKQGGTAKCPDNWSFNTYPRPTKEALQEDINRFCQNCEHLPKNDGGF